MDTDEEFLPFSESENQPSPVPEKKLKRLRKVTVTEKVSEDLPSPFSDELPSARDFSSSGSEALGTGETNSEYFEELSPQSGSRLEVLEKGIELDSGFENEEGSSGAQRHLEFDSLGEEFDGKGEDKLGTEVEEESEDLRTNEGSEKKRRNLDGFEGKGEKKRKKKVKDANDGYDENLFSVVSTKKERRERLKELRAESQRLLRETRDASFRPVPLVQKSVSSVLEKIRQRKQELSKKLVNMTEDSYSDGNDSVSRAFNLDFDREKILAEDKEADKDAEEISEEISSIPVAVEASVEAQGEQGSKDTSNESDKNVTSSTAMGDDLKQTFRAPVEDTQDLIFDSPASDSKDEIPSSPLEDVLAPSLRAMSLKLDSAPPDDISDDEEDNSKNIDPLRHGSADLTSSHKGDPVKAFLDDEAEEEDDSDDDRARFKDDEEDEDNMDSEELNDMIGPAYEEKPIDNEMRNQLHQKWLEQQDAVGTENLLQRLKCPSKQRETAFIEESEDEESEEEESEEEFDNDPSEGLVPRNAVRVNLKKAKEMIPLMFTDKDDVYVSSDDEETEKTLVKRNFSHKAEEQSTFLSPAEDGSSKDIFGLIKKLNGAPDAREKGKTSSYFNMPSSGRNRTLSSKSSFLSRGSRNSLPSFQKHGSSTVRHFVFERDDSNSRSAILTAENSSDTVQMENGPKKAATAKFSYSQVRSSSQVTESKGEKDSGPSLHEILRCPSIKSSHRNGGSMAGQVEAIYAAFKLDQYPIKKERGLSLRTS